MPFFDDSGPKPEDERGPAGRAFALLRDQLERMIALNLFVSLQSAPFLAAWAFPLPLVVQIALTTYSALALPAALLAVYDVMAQVSAGNETISGALLLSSVRKMIRPALLAWMPLNSLFFWLGAAALAFAGQGWLLPDTLARLGILILAVLSLYWGALAAAHPAWPFWRILAYSAKLFWRSPSPTLALGALTLLAVLLGIVSIAGMALITPVLVALLQTEYVRTLHGARQSGIEAGHG